IRVRRGGPPDGPASESAARNAAAAMRSTGTVLVGDISNTLLSPRLLAEAGLEGVVFHELLGFNHPDPAGAVREAQARITAEARALADRARDHGLTMTIVAHAPY